MTGAEHLDPQRGRRLIRDLGSNRERAIDQHFSSARAQATMIRDLVRTSAYRIALERSVPNRVCVELGCGSGVLACIAAKAGARHVYAIEQTSIIAVAERLAEANGLADRITFVRGRSSEAEIPERADVVYSELLGNDPFDEGMVPTVADAVARFLKPDGAVIPSRIEIHAAACESHTLSFRRVVGRGQAEQTARLAPVLGLNLDPLVDAVDAEYEAELSSNSIFSGPLTGDVPPAERLLTAPALIADLDLKRMQPTDSFLGHADLIASSDGQHNAMFTFWTAWLSDGVHVSTWPYSDPFPDSWQGAVVTPIDPVVALEEGARLRIAHTIQPSPLHRISFRRD